MINLKINEKSVKGNISPLTLFLYKQEFNQGLLEDGLTLIYEENTALLSKIMWAMIKTVDYQLEIYSQWIETVTEQDINKNQYLIEFEIANRLLIRSADKDEDVIKKKEDKTDTDISISILKIITDLGMDLELVNLMSLDSFVKYQELYETQEKTNIATPEQVDNFFL